MAPEMWKGDVPRLFWPIDLEKGEQKPEGKHLFLADRSLVDLTQIGTLAVDRKIGEAAAKLGKTTSEIEAMLERGEKVVW